MNKKCFQLLLLISCLFIHSLAFSSTESGPTYVEGDVLIVFKSDATNETIKAVEDKYQLDLFSQLPHLNLRIYHHDKNISTKDLVETLRKLDSIKSVEFNYISKGNGIPTDPSFDKQWYLHNTGQEANAVSGAEDIDIDWPEAMDIYSGTETILVAVLGTGIAYDHPELASKMWANQNEIPGNGIDDDSNGYIDDIHGWDFINDDGIPYDTDGHETLVASIIAAQMDNGEGVTGISPNVELMSVKLCANSGKCDSADFLMATTYAAMNGAQIINYSSGGYSYSQIAYDQISWLEEQGILFVTSAGNDSIQTENKPHYPSSYNLDNIISVAATDRTNFLASFSNYGNVSVDLAAPGTEIYGANIETVTNVFSEDFESLPIWATGQEADSQSILDWSYYTDPTGNVWLTDSVDSSFQPIDYKANTNSWIVTPTISLGFFPKVEFQIWADNSNTDLLHFEISRDGINWESIQNLYGSMVGETPSNTTDPASLGVIKKWSLPGYQYEDVIFRFRMTSNSSLHNDGVYIDNFLVSDALPVMSYDGNEYYYSQGTSFSAPIVTGIAALLMSERPDLNYKQIKQIILDTVDKVDDLAPWLLTGGTANVHKALLKAIDYNAGIVEFETATYNSFEGDGNASITLIRTSGSDGEVTLQYETSDNTAVAGTDYVQQSGSVTFADGETSKTIFVEVLDDVTEEQDKDFTITITQLNGATMGTQTSAIVAIADDDAPGVQFSNSSYNTGEESNSILVTVMRTGDLSGEVTVDYTTSDGSAVADIDYSTTSGTLMFADGESSKTIEISIFDDAEYEQEEAFNITLTNPVGASLGMLDAASVTITDNDKKKGNESAIAASTESSGGGASATPLGLFLLLLGILWRRKLAIR